MRPNLDVKTSWPIRRPAHGPRVVTERPQEGPTISLLGDDLSAPLVLEAPESRALSSCPELYWMNAHGRAGELRERFKLIEIVENLGSSEQWAFVLVRNSRVARFVQACGRSGGGISIEVGDRRGARLVVHKSNDAGVEVPQICGGWLYWTLSTAIFAEGEAIQIFESWLTSGQAPPALELQAVRNGGGWVDGAQSRL
jgi:hypothetical protein